MSNGANIDPAALADARERLEARYKDGTAEGPFETSAEFEAFARAKERILFSDLRLVLDALKEARRQAFEEAADIANDKVISCCDDDYQCGSNEAASTIEREIRALAAKEPQP